jgi:outer membrane protease
MPSSMQDMKQRIDPDSSVSIFLSAFIIMTQTGFHALGVMDSETPKATYQGPRRAKGSSGLEWKITRSRFAPERHFP